MHHHLSPTATAVLLILALVLDYSAPGSDSVRDRVAFMMGVPAIYEGFNGGPAEQYTIGFLGGVIDRLKHAGGNSYIAGATTSVIIAVLVGVLFFWALGCLLPVKWATKMGMFGGIARLTFPTTAPTSRMNVKLWVAAFAIGILCDLPSGFVGDFMRWFVTTLVSIFGLVPSLLFGSM